MSRYRPQGKADHALPPANDRSRGDTGPIAGVRAWTSSQIGHLPVPRTGLSGENSKAAWMTLRDPRAPEANHARGACAPAAGGGAQTASGLPGRGAPWFIFLMAMEGVVVR